MFYLYIVIYMSNLTRYAFEKMHQTVFHNDCKLSTLEKFPVEKRRGIVGLGLSHNNLYVYDRWGIKYIFIDTQVCCSSQHVTLLSRRYKRKLMKHIAGSYRGRKSTST